MAGTAVPLNAAIAIAPRHAVKTKLDSHERKTDNSAVGICVIFNPTARGDKARRFRRQLDAIASECALKPTIAPGDATRLAAAAVAEGFTTIVAAGGDGTVNEVANGIANAPDGLQKTRLGILPLGSVNVLAKELDLPTNLARAWEVIQRGRERRVDLPWMEFAGATGTERRAFVILAGAGLDARAVELVKWGIKKRLGTLAYMVAGWRALNEARTPMTVTCGNTTIESAELVLFGNGRYYGGRLPFFVKARMDDGQFDVCVFTRFQRWRLPSYLWALFRGRLAELKGVHYFQTDSLTLTSGERVPLELDGDAVGHLPAKVSIQPQALRLVVP